MNKKETLRNVIKVFEVANKLKRDILAQYDAEFDIWDTKDKRGILKIPFFDSYNDIIADYANMIKYLDNKLNKYAIKYELDYIFFISYDHRSNLLNVNHKLENEYFNNELMNLILNKSNSQIINNTKKYLKLCDPSTYTLIDYLILTN